jgi:hypothetical protein
MSKRPFIVEPLRGRSGVHRLRSRTVRAAAFVELRNLLEVAPWNTVSITDVAAILAKYNLLPADAEVELRSILTRAAQHAVSHHQLNEVDEAGLKRLQEAFEFSDEKVRTVFLDAARDLYRQTLVDALADGHITSGERARLDRIAVDLGLSRCRPTRAPRRSSSVSGSSGGSTPASFRTSPCRSSCSAARRVISARPT